MKTNVERRGKYSVRYVISLITITILSLVLFYNEDPIESLIVFTMLTILSTMIYHAYVAETLENKSEVRR